MKSLFAIAALITVVHVALRLAGAAEHTSIIAGQAVSNASVILGPAYVLSYLAFVVVVPVALLGGIFEGLTRKFIDARGATPANR